MVKFLKKSKFWVLSSFIFIVSLLFAMNVGAEEISVDAKCPDYKFSSIDGSKITNSTNSGKTKLIIFFQVDCTASQNTLKEISNSDWVSNKNISIYAVDIQGVSSKRIQSFAKEYGNNGQNITFCSADSEVLFKILRAAGYKDNRVLSPASFIVDKKGNIKKYFLGSVSELSLCKNLVNYVDGLELPSISNVSVSGTFAYKEAFEILEIVNKERKKSGLNALTMNPDLLDAAMQRAAECSVYYGHTRPNGTDFSTVIDLNYLGENVAAGFTTAKEVMNGWMNSPAHRENILRETYDCIGIGVFYQDGVKYWSQLFSKDCPTVSAKETSNKNGIADIEILDENLSISISPSTLSLSAGKKKTLEVFTKNTTFYDTEIKLDPSCLTFKSSDSTAVSVSSKGVVSAKSKSPANITISVGGKTLTLSVPVNSLPQPNVKLTTTPSGVKISWGKVTGAKTYKIYKSTYSGGKWTGYKLYKTTSATSYTDTNIKSGTRVRYTVYAVNGSYKSTYKTGVITTFLSQPNVKVSNTSKGVKISWGKVTGAKTYKIYKSTYSGGKWTDYKLYKTTSATSYTDTNIKSGTRVRYTVYAVSGSYKSTYKTGVITTFLSQPNVKVSNTSKGVKISWGKITGAKTYKIYKSTYSGKKWSDYKLYKTTSSTSYTNTNLKSGTKVRYTVYAVSGSYKSAYKTGVSITYRK